MQANYENYYFIPDSLVSLNRSSGHFKGLADPNKRAYSIQMMIEALINAKNRIKLCLYFITIFRPVHEDNNFPCLLTNYYIGQIRICPPDDSVDKVSNFRVSDSIDVRGVLPYQEYRSITNVRPAAITSKLYSTILLRSVDSPQKF